MKKTAMLILSLPFSAAFAGDYGRMDGAFQQNVQALREVKENIDAAEGVLYAKKKDLLQNAIAKLEEAKARKTVFDGALASVKERNPRNAAAGHLSGEIALMLADADGIHMFAAGVLAKDAGPFKNLRRALCENYNAVNISGAETIGGC